MLTAFTYALILLTVALMLASLRNPGIMAALMWSMFSLEQLLQRGNDFLIERTSWVNIGLTAWSMVVIFNSLRLNRFRGFQIPLQAVVLYGLLGMAALSYYWSVDPPKTLEELWKYLPYMIAFAVLTPLCTVDQAQIHKAINTTVWFGGLVLLGHALTNYGVRGVILDSFRGRAMEANPLAVATYAGYVGICGIFSAYGQRLDLTGLVRIGVLLLAGWIIIRSGSRGQLIALAAVCMVWLPITTRATFKRSTILAVLSAVVLIALGIWFVEKYEWSGRWSWEKIAEAREGRWAMAVGLLEYWANSGVMRWLFGLGNSSSFKLVGFYPHNSVIEVLGEEGIVGLLLFTIFVLSGSLAGMRMMFHAGLPVTSRSNLGVLLAMFSFEFILTLKQGSLLGDSMLQCLGLTIGLALVACRRQLLQQAIRARQERLRSVAADDRQPVVGRYPMPAPARGRPEGGY